MFSWLRKLFGGSQQAFQGSSELEIEDLKEGAGELADYGKEVAVHYSGWLYDPDKAQNKGRKFDSSLDRAEPFNFIVGAGHVIAGWDQGVRGMRVGGRRRLVIPPALAYGERGAGGVIPANASLVFEVELLEVKSL